MADILNELATVVEQRKGQDPDVSYVASLYQQGPDAVLKKLGEEATEVVLAAKNEDKQSIIHEVADLWFHSLILLSSHGLGPDDVYRELAGRFGTSGLKEKAERGK